MVTISIIRSKVHPLIEGNTWEPADHPSHPQPQRLTRNRTKEAVVGFTAIPRDVNSLTAQISSLITLSDYFCFLELQTPVLWCWLATVSIRTDLFVRTSF